jgi:beta-glucosidase-like glycosyl hydrolase
MAPLVRVALAALAAAATGAAVAPSSASSTGTVSPPSSSSSSSASSSTPLYRVKGAPIDARVQDLLGRMTLQEKVAQTLNPVGSQDGPGHFAVNASYVLENWGLTGLGTLYTGIGGCAPGLTGCECQNYLQAAIINSSRLGIPVSFIGETLVSGCAGATIFPQPVLMGATFNPSLMTRIGTSIARQARLGGIDRGLSPVLQVDTDARFGRFEESYGEDPFLVSTMGVAVALALQGNGDGPNTYIPDNEHISLEAKHYMAYGYGGRDYYGAELSDRYLYDVYAKPWRAFVREAGGRGAMIAHPSVNGLPLHGSRLLMTDVLRNWFGGGDNGTGSYMLLASDWGNVEAIPDYGVAVDATTAGAMAAWAGLDNEMSPPPLAMANLVVAVQSGLFAVKYVDRAAGNNLREKFATGLFDGAWELNCTALATQLDQPADRALAYEVASEGIVLLKNDNNLLPLAGWGTTITKVALVGPLGDCNPGEKYACLAQQGMAGHYVQYGASITTLGAALRNATGITYTYTAGASIDTYDESGIAAAVAAAQDADVILVAVGDSIPIGSGTCSEMIDADTIDLPGSQLALLANVSALGKPVVTLLFTCRPVTFGAGPFSRWGPNNALLGALPAVVAAWRPGEEAGNAVLDMLTGKFSPSGRLTQNWIRNVGAVKGPASPYLQVRGSTNDAYHTEPATPLFPFGFGLSYAAVTVGAVTISPDPTTYIFQPGDVYTISGTVSSKGPDTRYTLLAFFSQKAPTKWARFGTALCAFTKIDVPANSASVPFTIVGRIADFDGFEPTTGDYEVFTGTYTVNLMETAAGPTHASFELLVNGTYNWSWDFAQ